MTSSPTWVRYDGPPDWKEILKFFRGSELQNYFTRMLEKKMKALIKIQYVDAISKNPKVAEVSGESDSRLQTRRAFSTM